MEDHVQGPATGAVAEAHGRGVCSHAIQLRRTTSSVQVSLRADNSMQMSQDELEELLAGQQGMAAELDDLEASLGIGGANLRASAGESVIPGSAMLRKSAGDSATAGLPRMMQAAGLGLAHASGSRHNLRVGVLPGQLDPLLEETAQEAASGVQQPAQWSAHAVPVDDGMQQIIRRSLHSVPLDDARTSLSADDSAASFGFERFDSLDSATGLASTDKQAMAAAAFTGNKGMAATGRHYGLVLPTRPATHSHDGLVRVEAVTTVQRDTGSTDAYSAMTAPGTAEAAAFSSNTAAGLHALLHGDGPSADLPPPGAETDPAGLPDADDIINDWCEEGDENEEGPCYGGGDMYGFGEEGSCCGGGDVYGVGDHQLQRRDGLSARAEGEQVGPDAITEGRWQEQHFGDESSQQEGEEEEGSEADFGDDDVTELLYGSSTAAPAARLAAVHQGTTCNNVWPQNGTASAAQLAAMQQSQVALQAGAAWAGGGVGAEVDGRAAVVSAGSPTHLSPLPDGRRDGRCPDVLDRGCPAGTPCTAELAMGQPTVHSLHTGSCGAAVSGVGQVFAISSDPDSPDWGMLRASHSSDPGQANNKQGTYAAVAGMSSGMVVQQRITAGSDVSELSLAGVPVGEYRGYHNMAPCPSDGVDFSAQAGSTMVCISTAEWPAAASTLCNLNDVRVTLPNELAEGQGQGGALGEGDEDGRLVEGQGGGLGEGGEDGEVLLGGSCSASLTASADPAPTISQYGRSPDGEVQQQVPWAQAASQVELTADATDVCSTSDGSLRGAVCDSVIQDEVDVDTASARHESSAAGVITEDSMVSPSAAGLNTEDSMAFPRATPDSEAAHADEIQADGLDARKGDAGHQQVLRSMTAADAPAQASFMDTLETGAPVPAMETPASASCSTPLLRRSPKRTASVSVDDLGLMPAEDVQHAASMASTDRFRAACNKRVATPSADNVAAYNADSVAAYNADSVAAYNKDACTGALSSQDLARCNKHFAAVGSITATAHNQGMATPSADAPTACSQRVTGTSADELDSPPESPHRWRMSSEGHVIMSEQQAMPLVHASSEERAHVSEQPAMPLEDRAACSTCEDAAEDLDPIKALDDAIIGDPCSSAQPDVAVITERGSLLEDVSVAQRPSPHPATAQEAQSAASEVPQQGSLPQGSPQQQLLLPPSQQLTVSLQHLTNSPRQHQPLSSSVLQVLAGIGNKYSQAAAPTAVHNSTDGDCAPGSDHASCNNLPDLAHAGKQGQPGAHVISSIVDHAEQAEQGTCAPALADGPAQGQPAPSIAGAGPQMQQPAPSNMSVSTQMQGEKPSSPAQPTSLGPQQASSHMSQPAGGGRWVEEAGVIAVSGSFAGLAGHVSMWGGSRSAQGQPLNEYEEALVAMYHRHTAAKQRLEAKQQQYREALASAELQDCSFKPQVSPGSRRLLHKTAGSPPPYLQQPAWDSSLPVTPPPDLAQQPSGLSPSPSYQRSPAGSPGQTRTGHHAPRSKSPGCAPSDTRTCSTLKTGSPGRVSTQLAMAKQQDMRARSPTGSPGRKTREHTGISQGMFSSRSPAGSPGRAAGGYAAALAYPYAGSRKQGGSPGAPPKDRIIYIGVNQLAHQLGASPKLQTTASTGGSCTGQPIAAPKLGHGLHVPADDDPLKFAVAAEEAGEEAEGAGEDSSSMQWHAEPATSSEVSASSCGPQLCMPADLQQAHVRLYQHAHVARQRQQLLALQHAAADAAARQFRARSPGRSVIASGSYSQSQGMMPPVVRSRYMDGVQARPAAKQAAAPPEMEHCTFQPVMATKQRNSRPAVNNRIVLDPSTFHATSQAFDDDRLQFMSALTGMLPEDASNASLQGMDKPAASDGSEHLATTEWVYTDWMQPSQTQAGPRRQQQLAQMGYSSQQQLAQMGYTSQQQLVQQQQTTPSRQVAGQYPRGYRQQGQAPSPTGGLRSPGGPAKPVLVDWQEFEARQQRAAVRRQHHWEATCEEVAAQHQPRRSLSPGSYRILSRKQQEGDAYVPPQHRQLLSPTQLGRSTQYSGRSSEDVSSQSGSHRNTAAATSQEAAQLSAAQCARSPAASRTRQSDSSSHTSRARSSSPSSYSQLHHSSAGRSHSSSHHRILKSPKPASPAASQQGASQSPSHSYPVRHTRAFSPAAGRGRAAVSDDAPAQQAFKPQITQKAARLPPPSLDELHDGGRAARAAWLAALQAEQDAQEAAQQWGQLAYKARPNPHSVQSQQGHLHRVSLSQPGPYLAAMTARRKQLEAQAAASVTAREAAELSECTFWPATNRVLPAYLTKAHPSMLSPAAHDFGSAVQHSRGGMAAGQAVGDFELAAQQQQPSNSQARYTTDVQGPYTGDSERQYARDSHRQYTGDDDAQYETDSSRQYTGSMYQQYTDGRHQHSGLEHQREDHLGQFTGPCDQYETAHAGQYRDVGVATSNALYGHQEPLNDETMWHGDGEQDIGTAAQMWHEHQHMQHGVWPQAAVDPVGQLYRPPHPEHHAAGHQAHEASLQAYSHPEQHVAFNTTHGTAMQGFRHAEHHVVTKPAHAASVVQAFRPVAPGQAQVAYGAGKQPQAGLHCPQPSGHVHGYPGQVEFAASYDQAQEPLLTEQCWRSNEVANKQGAPEPDHWQFTKQEGSQRPAWPSPPLPTTSHSHHDGLLLPAHSHHTHHGSLLAPAGYMSQVNPGPSLIAEGHGYGSVPRIPPRSSSHSSSAGGWRSISGRTAADHDSNSRPDGVKAAGQHSSRGSSAAGMHQYSSSRVQSRSGTGHISSSNHGSSNCSFGGSSSGVGGGREGMGTMEGLLHELSDPASDPCNPSSIDAASAQDSTVLMQYQDKGRVADMVVGSSACVPGSRNQFQEGAVRSAATKSTAGFGAPEEAGMLPLSESNPFKHVASVPGASPPLRDLEQYKQHLTQLRDSITAS